MEKSKAKKLHHDGFLTNPRVRKRGFLSACQFTASKTKQRKSN